MIPDGERPIEKVIGENIERYFKQSGMKLSELSLAVNKTANTNQFKKLMAGEANITIKTLQKIAGVLGVKTIDLIEDWAE